MRETGRYLAIIALLLAVCTACGWGGPGSTGAVPRASSQSAQYVPVASAPGAGPSAACAPRQPVIEVDPGHSGGIDFTPTAEVDGRRAVRAVNPYTRRLITYQPVYITGSGIRSIDNGGYTGELHTMWLAALQIRKILRAHGYLVYLTKTIEDEQVGLLERVARAMSHHPDLAVSLHFSGPTPVFPALFGHPYPDMGVTPQAFGEFRTNYTGGQTISFKNMAVAQASLRDARIIRAARAAQNDHESLAPLANSFPKSRGLPAWGNISIVQVADQVFPWVYNEDGAVGFNFDEYTTGIADGIMQAVPIRGCSSGASGSTSTSPSSSVAASTSSTPASVRGCKIVGSELIGLPSSQLPSPKPTVFIKSIVPYAQAAQKKYGVPAAVTIAQAIVESRFGTSVLATKAQNYFGIKCRAGQTGVSYQPYGASRPMPFRSFSDLRASVMGYADHLATASAYTAAMKARSDPIRFIEEEGPIYSGGGTTYVAALLRQVSKYKLAQYDKVG